MTKLWSPDGGNEASTTRRSTANSPESLSSMDKNAVSMTMENSQLKKLLAEVTFAIASTIQALCSVGGGAKMNTCIIKKLDNENCTIFVESLKPSQFKSLFPRFLPVTFIVALSSDWLLYF